jgi:hypothetical protein
MRTISCASSRASQEAQVVWQLAELPDKFKSTAQPEMAIPLRRLYDTGLPLSHQWRGRNQGIKGVHRAHQRF